MYNFSLQAITLNICVLLLPNHRFPSISHPQRTFRGVAVRIEPEARGTGYLVYTRFDWVRLGW